MKRSRLPIIVTVEHPDDDHPDDLWRGVHPELSGRAAHLWNWSIVDVKYGEPQPDDGIDRTTPPVRQTRIRVGSEALRGRR